MPHLNYYYDQILRVSLFIWIVSLSPQNLLATTDSLSIEDIVPELLDSFNLVFEDKTTLQDDAKYIKRIRKKLDTIQPSAIPQVSILLKKYEAKTEADSVFLRKQNCYLAFALLKRLGQTDQALSTFLLAHNYGIGQAIPPIPWHIENQIAILFNMKGDHENSEYFYLKTIEFLKKKLTSPYLTANESIQINQNIGRALNGLGYLYYWNKEYKKANQTVLKGLSISRKYNSLFGEAKALIYLTRLAVAQNNGKQAKIHLNQLNELSDKIPKNQSHIIEQNYRELAAFVFDHLNQPQQAIQFAKDFISNDKGSQDTYARTVAKQQILLAQQFLKLDSLSAARKELRNGASSLQEEFTRKLTESKNTTSDVTFSELYEVAANYFMQEYDKSNQKKYLDSAYLALEVVTSTYANARAEYLFDGSALLNIAANRRALNHQIEILAQLLKRYPDRKSELITKLDEKFIDAKNVMLRKVQQQRIIVQRLTDKQKAEFKKLNDSITQVELAFPGQENKFLRITKQMPFVRAKKMIIQQFQEASITTNQRALKFIDFIITADHTYALSNFTGERQFIILDSASRTINQVFDIQKKMNKKSVKYDITKDLNDCFNNLFNTITTLPEEFSVYPDGVLNMLPFAALVDNQNKYLVENHIISIGQYDRSLTPSANHTNQFVIVNPSYPDPPGIAVDERFGLWKLPFAENEISAIKNSIKKNISTINSPTRKLFASLIQGIHTLHYTGHAFVKENQAYLALSADSTDFLTANEIAKMNGSSDLVVLSACETGLGKLDDGEGLRSLARSFLLSGTRSVVYSLWRVNDQATAEIMKSFYTAKTDNSTNSEALAMAQLDWLNMHNNTHRHPYYWAGLQFTSLESQEKSTKRGSHYIIGLALLLVCIFLFRKFI